MYDLHIKHILLDPTELENSNKYLLKLENQIDSLNSKIDASKETSNDTSSLQSIKSSIDDLGVKVDGLNKTM